MFESKIHTYSLRPNKRVVLVTKWCPMENVVLAYWPTCCSHPLAPAPYYAKAPFTLALSISVVVAFLPGVQAERQTSAASSPLLLRNQDPVAGPARRSKSGAHDLRRADAKEGGTSTLFVSSER